MFFKGQVNLSPGYPWFRIPLERKCSRLSVCQVITFVASGVGKDMGLAPMSNSILGRVLCLSVLALVLHLRLFVLGEGIWA